MAKMLRREKEDGEDAAVGRAAKADVRTRGEGGAGG
jgi:hypothetical protein